MQKKFWVLRKNYQDTFFEKIGMHKLEIKWSNIDDFEIKIFADENFFRKTWNIVGIINFRTKSRTLKHQYNKAKFWEF